MAIKSGQVIWTADGFIIDRLQTASVNPNVPKEKIYELGNNKSVATVRDIPELSFDVESYDVSCKFEAQILGISPGTLTAGQQLDFNLAQPLNILSPFRTSQQVFTIVNGAIVPHLGLQQVAYKFGVKSDASQTYTFKGDSVFYTPGVPVEDVFTGDGTTKSWTLSKTAIAYLNTTFGTTQYVLNVSVYNPDGTSHRLFNGTAFDYTDTSTSLTLNASTPAPISGAIIRVHYGATVASDPYSIPQSSNDADGISVKPAAIRAKDIDVFIGTNAATPVFSRWTGVQGFDMTWSVNLDANEEFGNPLVVSQDYVAASVDGTITTRDNTVAELFAKMAAASNVPANQVIGALSSTPLPMEIHLNDPETGTRLKTIYVPDARFDPPEINGRVNQKIETPFKFTSDTGTMFVYNGARPGGNSQP